MKTFADCPSTFYPVKNKCYKMMPAAMWANQHRDCIRSQGVLFPFSNSDADKEAIAKKLMTVYSVDSVLSGLQMDGSADGWRSDSYSAEPTDYEFSDDKITTANQHKIIQATLDSGTFTYGFVHSGFTSSAICEFSNFTNPSLQYLST